MPEPAHELRIAPQLAHDLGLKQRGEPVLGLFARNVLEDRDRELAPEHGGDLRQPARTVREPVDPGDEEALEGRWKQEGRLQGRRPRAMPRLQPSRFDERAQELLEVKRISSARSTSSAPRASSRKPEQRREDLPRSLRGERFEGDLGCAVGEVGKDACSESPALRAGVSSERRDEQERRALGQLEEILRELARRRMRPVEVLDRQRDRGLRGERLDPRDVGMTHLGFVELEPGLGIETDAEEPGYPRQARNGSPPKSGSSLARARADDDLGLPEPTPSQRRSMSTNGHDGSPPYERHWPPTTSRHPVGTTAAPPACVFPMPGSPRKRMAWPRPDSKSARTDRTRPSSPSRPTSGRSAEEQRFGSGRRAASDEPALPDP